MAEQVRDDLVSEHEDEPRQDEVPERKYRRSVKAGDGFCRRAAAWLVQWVRPLPREPERPAMERGKIASCVPTKLDDKDAAESFLTHAKFIYEKRDARAARVEARATTLQASVAIATTLVLAAATLVLDSAKVASADWRRAFAVLFALVVLAFVMTGLFATRATLKYFRRERPQAVDAVRWSVEDAVGQRRHQGIDLLYRAGQNVYLDEFRFAQVEAARLWYRLALVLVILSAALLGVYAWTL